MAADATTKAIATVLCVACFLLIGNYGVSAEWIGRETLEKELDYITSIRFNPGDGQLAIAQAVATLPERYSKTREEVEDALLKRVRAGIDQPRGTRERQMAIRSLSILMLYATEESVPFLEKLIDQESAPAGAVLRAIFAAKGNDAAEYAKRFLKEREDYRRYRIYDELTAVAGMAMRNELEGDEGFVGGIVETMRKFLEEEKDRNISAFTLIDRRLKQLDPEYAWSEYRRTLLEEKSRTVGTEYGWREYFQRELQELNSPPEEAPIWIGQDYFDEELDVLTRRYAHSSSWDRFEIEWAITTLPERYSKSREEVEKALIERLQLYLDRPSGTRVIEASGIVAVLLFYASEKAVPILQTLVDDALAPVSTYALHVLFAAKGNDAVDYAREVLEDLGDQPGYARYEIYQAFVGIVELAEKKMIGREEEFFERAVIGMREFLEEEKGRSIMSVILLDRGLKRVDPDYAGSEYRRELLQEMRRSAEREDRREYFRRELQEINSSHDKDDGEG